MSVLSELAAAHAGGEPAPKAKEKAGKSEISKPATKADRFEQLRLLEKSLNKQFDTTGSIQILGKRLGLDIPVISTQLPSLDYGVLECGGVPRGRIVEVYGPESCLDSNTHIHYTINKNGKRINHKGGTIKKLYERFHKINTHHLATNENVSFTAPCVNEEGRIFHNKIMDVVFTGRKPVYKITTKKGHTINATAEHKFFNGDKWIPLADLSSGDVLMIHDKTPFTCEYPDRINRQWYVFVKNHKVAGIKEIFDKKTGNTYVYHRLVKSRAVVEANMNGLSYEAYIERLNQGDIDDLAALPRDWHVHHVDEDCTNDNISNLVILNPTEHGRLHAIDRHNNLRYIIVEDIVESIAYVDYTDTYDVKMLSPFNNYIANNFVVHNSGKTTFCLHLVACEQQTTDNIVAYVDAEHALDINYAAKLGVNVNELLIAQPDSGEQALETVEALVESKIVSLIIIDSVAALVPRAELEGEMGDSVIYETPVYVRQKGTNLVDVVQIGDLYGGQKKGGIYKKTSRLEILTHAGWKPLLAVQKKKNTKSKEIVYTRTAQGYVGTTKDHSLFVDGKETSPSELKPFARLDTYDQSIETGNCNLITPDLAWLLGFYVAEGSTPKSKKHNRFEVSNTDTEPLEKCQEIIKRVFSLDAVLERKTEPTEIRKALYAVTCSSNSNLGWFMHQCISEKSRVKKIPSFILNGTRDVKKSFLDGFWHGDGNHGEPKKSRKFFNNSWAVMGGIKLINDRATSVVINNTRLDQLTLSESGLKMYAPNELRAMYIGDAPEFLYDLETECGTFVTAIGNIICHNSNMGLHARLMSQAMRKLRGKASENGVTLIFINQIREKIGTMFGNPEVTTGGRALKFFASVRLDVRRRTIIGEKDSPLGHELEVKATKNKVGSPMRSTLVRLIYGLGIEKETDFIEYAVKIGAMSKTNNGYYSFGEKKIGQGLTNVCECVRLDSDLKKAIVDKMTEIRKAEK